MEIFELVHKNNQQAVLALGAESAGNFSVFHDGRIYFSPNFGDLLDENNFEKFQEAVWDFLQKNKIKPDIILTDLHPLYKTTLWGAELAKKYKAKHIQVQHHLAHIFSAVGEQIILNTKYQLPDTIFGIALDGTGYGMDGKIWGGEAFAISNFQIPISKQISNQKSQKLKLRITRIGKLEDQIMIGGDLAVREPARILISILSKFLTYPSSLRAQRSNLGLCAQTARLPRSSEAGSLAMTDKKNFIYNFVKKYYTKNQFELLYNQFQNNFNCMETSSTGRVLDAVSVLLGFCKNERNYKHEPIDLLEKNSTIPYFNLKPSIIKNPVIAALTRNRYPFYKGGKPSPFKKGRDGEGFLYELNTTYLFEYLIKNISKDKRRLAATAQLYIAQGLFKIINNCHPERDSGSNDRFNVTAGLLLDSGSMSGMTNNIFLAGGISNNKIISNYFKAKNKKIYLVKSERSEFNGVPRGDAGISFGQIIYYLLS